MTTMNTTTTLTMTPARLIRLANADRDSLTPADRAAREAIQLDIADADRHTLYPFLRVIPAGHEVCPWIEEGADKAYAVTRDVYVVDRGCAGDFLTADLAEAVNAHGQSRKMCVVAG